MTDASRTTEAGVLNQANVKGARTFDERGQIIQPETNRSSVLEIFNRRYTAYDQAMQTLAKTSNLNEDQMLQLFRYETTKQGKDEVLDKKKGVIMHKIKDPNSGQEFTSRDGIAMEGMISYLESQIPQEANEAEKSKLQTDIDILNANLKLFTAAHANSLKDPRYFEARKAFEAQAYFQFRLKHNIQGNDLSDWQMAERILGERMELTLPKAKKKTPEAISSEVQEDIQKAKSLAELTGPTPSTQPLEDIDSSYFEQPQFVTERFLEDDLHKPVAKLSELEEARRNKKEGKLYAHQKVVDQMDTVEKLLTDPQIQQLLPIKDNETPDVYQKRLSVNLMARLRFHGKFEEKNDPLYLFLKDNLKDASGNPVPTGHWDEVLMGAEALNALSIKAGTDAKQKEYDQRMFDFHQRAERRRTAYGVDLGSDHQAATAALMEDHYLKVGEEGKVNKERAAEVDLVAFELVGQVLMDVGDVNNPALGKKPDGMPYTYAEVLHSLVSSVSQLAEEELQLKSQGQILSPEKQQQRDQLNQKLLHLREDFYLQTTDVLEKRHQQNPYTDQTSFGYLAFERLYGTGPGSLDLNSKTSTQAAQTLIDYYRGANPDYFPPNPTEVQQSRIDRIERRFNLLTSTSPDVIQLALKGADLMKRRIEALPPKPTLEKVPQRIYGKTFVDKGTYRGPVYEEEEVSVAPSKPAPTVTESVTGPGQEEEGGPSATSLAKEGEFPPAAPVPGEEKPEPPKPAPPEPTIVPPELALELNIGIAADPTRIQQEIGGLMQHDRAREKP